MICKKNNKKAVRRLPIPGYMKVLRRLNERSITNKVIPKTAPGSKDQRTSCPPKSWIYEKTNDRQAVIHIYKNAMRAPPPAPIFKGSPSKSLALETRRKVFSFILLFSSTIEITFTLKYFSYITKDKNFPSDCLATMIKF
jgi:hypothetical protein